MHHSKRANYPADVICLIKNQFMSINVWNLLQCRNIKQRTNNWTSKKNTQHTESVQF